MKAQLEKIEPDFGSSFKYMKFTEPCSNGEAYWHFHPELEIVYISSGSGKCHVGNHISYYNDGLLVLLGINLPHLGFYNRMLGNPQEVVVQMDYHFMGEYFWDIPEMETIKKMLDASKLGLIFSGSTKKRVGQKLLDLGDLNAFDRLLAFLNILKELAHSTEFEYLNAESYALNIAVQDHQRIDLIYQYVRNHFDRSIPLEEIAAETNMTVPSFCRYFKKITHKTFTQFVNEYRVVHACKLLAEEGLTIADVSFSCGFQNFSHFNKQFKKATGKSPSVYRKELKQVKEVLVE